MAYSGDVLFKKGKEFVGLVTVDGKQYWARGELMDTKNGKDSLIGIKLTEKKDK